MTNPYESAAKQTMVEVYAVKHIPQAIRNNVKTLLLVGERVTTPHGDGVVVGYELIGGDTDFIRTIVRMDKPTELFFKHNQMYFFQHEIDRGEVYKIGDCYE